VESLKLNSSLQELDLACTNIGVAGATVIAESLKLNSSLQRLSIGKNEVGDAGAEAMAEALKVNSSLRRLILSQNKIGDTGASAVAESLKLNTCLHWLNLSYNQIGYAGATDIAESLEFSLSFPSNTRLQVLDHYFFCPVIRFFLMLSKLGFRSFILNDVVRGVCVCCSLPGFLCQWLGEVVGT
jgi:Leucine-rich repeat (LRR) protein